MLSICEEAALEHRGARRLLLFEDPKLNARCPGAPAARFMKLPSSARSPHAPHPHPRAPNAPTAGQPQQRRRERLHALAAVRRRRANTTGPVHTLFGPSCSTGGPGRLIPWIKAHSRQSARWLQPAWAPLPARGPSMHVLPGEEEGGAAHLYTLRRAARVAVTHSTQTDGTPSTVCAGGVPPRRRATVCAA